MESAGYSTFRGNSSLETYKVTILNGEIFSEPIDLKGGTLIAIQVPSGFVGNTLELENSFDGINFFTPVNSDLTDITIEVIQDEVVTLNSFSLNFLSIVRLSTSTQTEDVQVILVIRH